MMLFTDYRHIGVLSVIAVENKYHSSGGRS